MYILQSNTRLLMSFRVFFYNPCAVLHITKELSSLRMVEYLLNTFTQYYSAVETNTMKSTAGGWYEAEATIEQKQGIQILLYCKSPQPCCTIDNFYP